MSKEENITPEVKAAIEDIVRNFPECDVLFYPDDKGGAFVIIEDIPLGHPYKQRVSWGGFHITFSCPHADVYPHFFCADLAREDGRDLGEGFGKNHIFPPTDVKDVPHEKRRAAVQISRRSNKRDNSSDLETPLVKLMKVIHWMMRR